MRKSVRVKLLLVIMARRLHPKARGWYRLDPRRHCLTWFCYICDQPAGTQVIEAKKYKPSDIPMPEAVKDHARAHLASAEAPERPKTCPTCEQALPIEDGAGIAA